MSGYDLQHFWESIPVGKSNAVTYEELVGLWGMSERQVRKLLAELSGFDNGDNYILIRSSRHEGFYRTDDPADISAYKRECRSRAMRTLAPIKKINRVLQSTAAENINLSFFNNLKAMRQARGITQTGLCARMREYDWTFDVSILSRLENGYVLPTPVQLHALSIILQCEPWELVSMQADGLEIYATQSGMQVI